MNRSPASKSGLPPNETTKRLEQTGKLLEEDAKRKLRIKYANTILRLMVFWMIAVVGLLIAHGAEAIPFELPNQVLIGLGASTVANSVGLAGSIIKYISS